MPSPLSNRIVLFTVIVVLFIVQLVLLHKLIGKDVAQTYPLSWTFCFRLCAMLLLLTVTAVAIVGIAHDLCTRFA